MHGSRSLRRPSAWTREAIGPIRGVSSGKSEDAVVALARREPDIIEHRMRRPREAGPPRTRGVDPAPEARDAPIYRSRGDGILIFVNDATCRAFGLAREALIGRSFWSLVPVTEHRRCRRHFAALTPEEPAGVIDHLAYGPGGTLMRHRWTIAVRFDEAGQVVDRLAIGEPLPSTRRRGHESLLVSRERLRAILDAIPDLVFQIGRAHV